MFRNCLLFSILSASMVANGQAGDQWIKLKGVYTQFDSDAVIQDEEGFGLGSGKWFTNQFGLGVAIHRNDLKSDNPGSWLESKQNQFLGSFLFNFNPGRARIFPYLAVGIGGIQIGKEFSPSGNRTVRFSNQAGLSAQLWIGEAFALTLDSKYVQIKTSTTRRDRMHSVGLGVVWGGRDRASYTAPTI